MNFKKMAERVASGAVGQTPSPVGEDMETQTVSVFVGISWDVAATTLDEALAAAREMAGLPADAAWELVDELGPGEVCGNLDMPEEAYEAVESGAGHFKATLRGVTLEWETT